MDVKSRFAVGLIIQIVVMGYLASKGFADNRCTILFIPFVLLINKTYNSSNSKQFKQVPSNNTYLSYKKLSNVTFAIFYFRLNKTISMTKIITPI